jgi:hypothetical protein
MSTGSSVFHAFTLKANGLIREIISDVGVSVPFVAAEVFVLTKML